MVDESVKFAWAYLLKYGRITDGSWEYYGSNYRFPTEEYGSIEKYGKLLEKVRDKAVSIGIDWNKTDIPSVDSVSVFNGTFNSGSYLQATLGTLVLKNGETYKIGSSDEDAAHLAETARQMIRGKSEVQDLADLI